MQGLYPYVHKYISEKVVGTQVFNSYLLNELFHATLYLTKKKNKLKISEEHFSHCWCPAKDSPSRSAVQTGTHHEGVLQCVDGILLELLFSPL